MIYKVYLRYVLVVMLLGCGQGVPTYTTSPEHMETSGEKMRDGLGSPCEDKVFIAFRIVSYCREQREGNDGKLYWNTTPSSSPSRCICTHQVDLYFNAIDEYLFFLEIY